MSARAENKQSDTAIGSVVARMPGSMLVIKAKQLRGDTALDTAAQAIGISKATLRKIEEGQTQKINMDVLAAMIEYYHCEVGDIIEVINE